MTDAWPWLGLALAALATSTLSAVVGLAGGLLLLALMLLFLDPLVAVPLHGVVQLASNFSRAHLQRRHVRWRLVGRFAWLLAPGGVAGMAVASSISPGALRVAIAVFVLGATWLPGLLRLGPGAPGRDPARRFVLVGALVGFANVLVGATGPLLAPFVLGLRLSRQAVIGTLAACQTLGHLVKVLLFGLWGFSFLAYAVPLLALCAAALAGSALGTRLLAHLPERGFRVGVRLVLTALAIRIAWQGVLGG